MTRMIAVTVVLFFLTTVCFAQKVYEVKYESQADLKVFVADYESQCDLKVYWVKYES